MVSLLFSFFSWTEHGDEIRHSWYQWVILALCLQAVMCYAPHFLWKSIEGEFGWPLLGLFHSHC